MNPPAPVTRTRFIGCNRGTVGLYPTTKDPRRATGYRRPDHSSELPVRVRPSRARPSHKTVLHHPSASENHGHNLPGYKRLCDFGPITRTPATCNTRATPVADPPPHRTRHRPYISRPSPQPRAVSDSACREESL